MKKAFVKSPLITFLVLCILVLSLSACTHTNKQTDDAEAVTASVVEIEKYGHAVLDITTADFTEKGYALGDIVHISFGTYEKDIPFYDGYYINPGDTMLRGLSAEKNIAVCINYGDLSEETGIAVGDSVEITLKEKAAMLPYQELCALKYSNDRAEYPDDATFTNFRGVTSGRIGEGKLYRTASPINNKNGRAAYADDFIESVNIATAVNLADSEEDIEEYLIAEDFDSEYYLSLYEDGKVILLDMTANFYSDEFAAALADGLRFLAENDAPYCVHCTEGKDRAGFTVMILSSLMGAELQEIIDDYMLSFYNYYGIDKEKEPERYEAVLNNNLIPMLCHVMGVNSKEELAQTDLEAAVTEYLLGAGMTKEELSTLKEKLS